MSAPPPSPQTGWKPTTTCDIDVWRSWDETLHVDTDGSLKLHLSAVQTNPSDSSEKAYCMKITIGCWGGSQLGQVPAGFQCDGSGPWCGRMCGAGRYHFPHQQEFDMGPRNYSAIVVNDQYTGWPGPGSSDPGSLVIFASSDGAFPDMVYRNADSSAIPSRRGYSLSNEMERYTSTCSTISPPPPPVNCNQLPNGNWPFAPTTIGCVKPMGGGGQLDWVKWRPETIMPLDCPN